METWNRNKNNRFIGIHLKFKREKLDSGYHHQLLKNKVDGVGQFTINTRGAMHNSSNLSGFAKSVSQASHTSLSARMMNISYEVLEWYFTFSFMQWTYFRF